MKNRHWIEWTGLIIGTLLGALLLYIFLAQVIGGWEGPINIPIMDAIGFVLLLTAVIGAVLAWFKTNLGAWLQIVGTLAFLIVLSIDRGRFLINMTFKIFIISGALILLGGVLKKEAG